MTTETHEIFESSPKAKAFIVSYEDKKGVQPYKRGKKLYPWNQMKIGESFVVDYGQDKRKLKADLKNMANQKRYINGKFFKVVSHDEHKILEVARIG